jgi:hypothetical protein
LLVEEWNIQNRIKRESKFANFEPARKREFLSNLAYELTAVYSRSNFDTNDLYKCYNTLHTKYGLPLEQQSDVVNEIETHNGLIIQSSYNTYEFAHKSLQEFLTAEYIVRMPTVPHKEHLITKMPNEIALAVALSSEPSEYFCYLIEKRLLNFTPELSFIKIFIYRLSIEKPEFSQSSYLGVCFLQLFSTYLSFIIEKDGKPKSGRSEAEMAEIVNIFTTLYEIGNLKSSTRMLKEYYKITATIETTYNNRVYTFVEINNKNKLNNSSEENIFPDTLVVSKFLLG